MNILDKIVEQKKLEVARLPARVIAAGDLRDAMLEHGERRDFISALKNPRIGNIGLIAEVKKASPSRGQRGKDRAGISFSDSFRRLRKVSGVHCGQVS